MICAVDIDIGEFTLVRTDGFAKQFPADIGEVVENIPSGSTVLIEVASPVFYHGDSKAAFTNTARWMVWNAVAAGALAMSIHQVSPHNSILVSPSSTWAMGYDEWHRHEFAGMKPISYKRSMRKGKEVVTPVYSKADGNHDIRECKAMIWSYTVKPSLWKPLWVYLDSI